MKIPKSSPQTAPPTKPMILKNMEDLHWQMQPLQLEVARRAYELFEARGCEHGHDWEDWFRAESELLRPVSVAVSEADDRISVRANVLGFEENEISVGIEPRRITIVGMKHPSVTETEGGKVEYIDWSPDLIMTSVDLPTEVTPEDSTIDFQGGLLNFELAKTEWRHKAKTAA